MPHAFINPESAHAVDAGLIGGELGQARFGHPPKRVPGGAELARQALDGGVLTDRKSVV